MADGLRFRSGGVLAERVVWARTRRERARGLRGTAVLGPGEALVIVGGAQQVHTFGVRFPLDVVFCDREWRIVHVASCMPPRRVTRWVWRARYVVEMRCGSLPPGTARGAFLEPVPEPASHR